MHTSFAIALGSNQRHARFGAPEAVLSHALGKLDGKKVSVAAVSHTMRSRPIGPSQRSYANLAAIVETSLSPIDLLDRLKKLERKMGRRAGGQRWGKRVIDLDIILWSGGIWASPPLAIPHPGFRTRSFVLQPLAAIAPKWRDPVSGLSVRHLKARLDRKRPLP